jgi:hypothetical protein
VEESVLDALLAADPVQSDNGNFAGSLPVESLIGRTAM